MVVISFLYGTTALPELLKTDIPTCNDHDRRATTLLTNAMRSVKLYVSKKSHTNKCIESLTMQLPTCLCCGDSISV